MSRQNGRMINRAFYEYLIDLDVLRSIVDAVVSGLRQGAGRRTIAAQTSAAYRAGIAAAVQNLAGMSSDYPRTVLQRLADDFVTRRAALAGARVFEYMDGFAGDVGQRLGRLLYGAIQDGLNPRDVERMIRREFDVSKTRALRIARTEITGALRRGRMDEAKDAGEKFGTEVMLIHYSALIPGRTRMTHAARHGKLVSVGDQRAWYEINGNAINCLLPNTPVRGNFVAGSRGLYQGKAVRIVTAAGNNISVTPNHPVMTDFGLVSAAKINVGDNLITNSIDVENLAGVGSLNGHLVDPTVEDVFGALVDLGHPRLAGVSAVDFHGDARRMDKYVNIVDANGVLSINMNSALAEFLNNVGLIKPDDATFRFGAHFLDALTVGIAASGSMSSLDALQSLFGAEIAILNELSVAGRPDVKATFLKPSVDGDPADFVLIAKSEDGRPRNVFGVNGINVKSVNHAKRLGPEPVLGEEFGNTSVAASKTISNALNRFSGLVSMDKVVSVDVFEYSGHVYDLQDVSGMMIAGNVVVSNCLCSATEVFVKNGKPLVSDKLLKRLADARGAFGG